MNVLLPQNLIDVIVADDTYSMVCWNSNVTNLPHVNYIISQGAVIDQQIIDYLTDPETPATPQLSVYVTPIPISLDRYKVAVDKLVTVNIHGCNFTPNTSITLSSGVVSDFEFIGCETIKIVIDSNGVAADSTIELSVDGTLAFTLETFTSVWYDFRLNGDVVDDYDLVNIEESEIVRDADGIGYTVSLNNWTRLLGIKNYTVPRDHADGIQLIYKIQNTGNNMFGLIADGHGVDNSMYNEQHAALYPNNQHNLWGFYAYTHKRNSRTITNYDRLKFVIHTTMTPGSEFSVYALSEDNEWDDVGELLYTDTMPDGNQDSGDTIYPCLIPRTAITARLQAFSPHGA